MELAAKDLRIDVFTSGVGQPRAVRITHMPSGAVGKGANVSELKAREEAMRALRRKLV